MITEKNFLRSVIQKKKKKVRNRKKDIKYILQLNLFWLFYDKECLARWVSSPKRGLYMRGSLLLENRIVFEVEFCEFSFIGYWLVEE